MYESWSGLSASQYRDFKGISNKDSLRDHMSLLEVASTIFSEATASEILSKTEAKSFFETRQAIHIAGKITKEAIEKIEKATGKKVVTHDNNKDLNSPEIQKKLIQEDSENKKLKNSNDSSDPKTKRK